MRIQSLFQTFMTFFSSVEHTKSYFELFFVDTIKVNGVQNHIVPHWLSLYEQN